MITPTTYAYKGKNAARDEHVYKHQKGFNALVTLLSTEGPLFKAWQEANQHYNSVCASTAIPGSAAGAKTREEALHAARMADLSYKAPMDIATASARDAGAPGLLSEEEWVELAFHKTPSLGTLGPVSQEEYKKAVDKAVADLKESYNKEYKDIFTADQYKRGTGAAVEHRTRYFDWLKGKPLTEAEAVLAKIDAKKDAPGVVDAEVRMQAKDNVHKDAAFMALSTDEQTKQEATFIDEEVKKIKSTATGTPPLTYDQRVEQKVKEIDAKKVAMQDELKYAKQSYSAGIEEMTFQTDATFSVLNIYQQDSEAHNKDNPTAPQMPATKKDEISNLVKAATKEEEVSVVANYHAHARRYEERFIKASKMGRYDADLRASREGMSEKKSAELEKIGDNKVRKANGDAMLINGIPCEQAASIEMFGIRTGSTWFGHVIGGGSNCVKDVGKFIEAFLVETAAANNAAHQKQRTDAGLLPEPLSVLDMLKAYSKDEFQKNEKGEVIHGKDGQPLKNENMQNGSPLNALRISSFPVSGGVKSTLEALANMKAMGDILGFEVTLDFDAIVSNSAGEDQPMAKRVRHESYRRLGPDDDVYLQPAKKAIIEHYGLTGTAPEQREQLVRKLTGNATTASNHGVLINATDSTEAAIAAKATSTLGSSDKATKTETTTAPAIGSSSHISTEPAPPTLIAKTPVVPVVNVKNDATTTTTKLK